MTNKKVRIHMTQAIVNLWIREKLEIGAGNQRCYAGK